MARFANLLFMGVVCLAVSMVSVSMTTMAQRDTPRASSAEVAQAMAQSRTAKHTDNDAGKHTDNDAAAKHTVNAAPLPASAVSAQHSVHIRRPSGPPQVSLSGSDPQGRAARLACSTCHSVRQPNLQNTTSQTLDEFHQGLQVSHGQLACYACHNPSNVDTLRLADGSPVEYADVMDLCTQCHSKQADSFAHGAHGGMNGFWDLSRGPQTKNNCIDCHDPHAPIFPKMIVDFKPRDRFLDLDTKETGHEQHK